jgi:plastocyanin
MKRTARKRIGLSLAAGIAALSLSLSGGFAPSSALAQDLSHPAHIHNGDCSAPGDVIAPLTNLTGTADLTTSDTVIADMTIADLLATPHAIVTHESDDNIGNYLACGNVAGVVEEGTLTVGLAELNGSGVEAVAFIQDTDAGVQVSILEIEDAAVEGMAMDMETDAHPSHVHTGDCTAPADVVFPLSDIAPIAGMAEGGTPSLLIEQGYTEIDTTLADLTAAPHSIVAHLSMDEIGTYLVCGDIATMDGAEADETMVPLMELAGSGYVGAAYLQDTTDGKLAVSVFLFPGVSGMGTMATPEAMGETDHSMGSPEAEMGDMAGEAVTATIEGFAFLPGDLEVAAGTTVTWTNNDSAPHTVTATDGSFQSGTLEQGDTFSYTFETAGEFSYFCEFHANMTATVTVS